MGYFDSWIGLLVVGVVVAYIFLYCLGEVAGRADDRISRPKVNDDEDEDLEDFIKRTGGHW